MQICTKIIIMTASNSFLLRLLCAIAPCVTCCLFPGKIFAFYDARLRLQPHESPLSPHRACAVTMTACRVLSSLDSCVTKLPMSTNYANCHDVACSGQTLLHCLSHRHRPVWSTQTDRTIANIETGGLPSISRLQYSLFYYYSVYIMVYTTSLVGRRLYLDSPARP